MHLLESAVVDITLLLATCRALREHEGAPQRRGQRRELRVQVKRGALAYLEALARAEATLSDADLLATCRVAAECEMADALACVDDLRTMMQAQAGALAGYAPARHDLWRLSHIAIHLRRGVAGLRERVTLDGRRDAPPKPARRAPARDAAREAPPKAARRLGKRLRRALVAYARAVMRGESHPESMVRAARRAATRALGARSLADAAKLARVELDVEGAPGLIGKGVARPLTDLMLDWDAAVDVATASGADVDSMAGHTQTSKMMPAVRPY